MTGRALIAVSLMLVGGAAAAHHSPVNFNLETDEFAVTGTIASVSFRNPHSVIELEVQSAAGDTTVWYVEFSSVNLLLRRGWDMERIEAGDIVTCIGNPSRDGTPEMYMWTIRLDDGTEFGR